MNDQRLDCCVGWWGVVGVATIGVMCSKDAVTADPRDQRIGELEQSLQASDKRIEELAAEVLELRARLGLDSENSLKPPSSDGPAGRWVVTQDTRGAVVSCCRWRREKVDNVVSLVPETCDNCKGLRLKQTKDATAPAGRDSSADNRSDGVPVPHGALLRLRDHHRRRASARGGARLWRAADGSRLRDDELVQDVQAQHEVLRCRHPRSGIVAGVLKLGAEMGEMLATPQPKPRHSSASPPVRYMVMSLPGTRARRTGGRVPRGLGPSPRPSLLSSIFRITFSRGGEEHPRRTWPLFRMDVQGRGQDRPPPTQRTGSAGLPRRLRRVSQAQATATPNGNRFSRPGSPSSNRRSQSAKKRVKQIAGKSDSRCAESRS